MYPLFIYLLAIILPENILSETPFLLSMINYLEQYIPTLRGIELRAKYPDVFQTLYFIHLLSIFLLMIVMKKTGCIRSENIKYSNTVWPFLSCLLFITLFVWGFFSHLFSEGFGEGTTRFAKTAQSIRDSRLGFSLWTGFIVITLSLSILGFFLSLIGYVKHLLNIRR